MRLCFLLNLSVFISIAHLHAQQEGYAVIKNDTIYGRININFAAGNIIIEHDSVNRVYLNDIKSITFYNKLRDTYLGVDISGKTTFFKLLVAGNPSLLEKEGNYYCKRGDEILIIDQRLLYDIFGKKEVKEYTFARNISLETVSGLIDLFRYYNGDMDI